jgi:flagellar motor component MotA
MADTSAGTSETEILKSKEKILSIYKRCLKDGKITEETDSEEKTPVKSEPISMLKKKKVSQFTIEELKSFFYELCRKAHFRGILQLESDAELVDDDLIKKGLELIVDGTDPSLVESILKTKLEKALRDYKVKYESSINALLDIQKGFYPEMVKERLNASM